MNYEYLHLQFQSHIEDNISTKYNNDWLAMINDYGSQGWHLSQMIEIHGGYHFVMERELK
jgi:hypothetical protein